jgi:hypothetical protein
LLTQCLRTAAPKPEVLLFIRKKLYQWNRQIYGTFSERLPSVCNSVVVVSPHPLSPASSTFSTINTPEYTEEEPNDHK